MAPDAELESIFKRALSETERDFSPRNILELGRACGFLQIQQDCNIEWYDSAFKKSLPFRHKEFDLVISALYLDSQSDLKPLFLEISRILSRNGRYRLLEYHPKFQRPNNERRLILGEHKVNLAFFQHSVAEIESIALGCSLKLLKQIEWNNHTANIQKNVATKNLQETQARDNNIILVDLEFEKF